MRSGFAVSFNQPNLSTVATWNRNGIIFANESILGVMRSDIVIDTKNLVYILSEEKKRIFVWHNNSINPTQNISANFGDLKSIFVTTNGDIYVSAHLTQGSTFIMRWISETNAFTLACKFSYQCDDIFIDIDDNIYCSMSSGNVVFKRNLKSPKNQIVVAGMNGPGSDSNQLIYPCGIFVDVNFDLFVADSGNNRIQLFLFGETNAITVAGRQSTRPTIELYMPTGITLDAKKYLFIVEEYYNRIVGEGPCGFRCLIGCYEGDTESRQRLYPYSMSFDSLGNIFHTDSRNNRIIKYQLTEISSGE
ncbi:unnamed protein product [Adineta ricciae]|uniref:Uncharacterized protein n=1 Tax=Adineta ricciae TaxID=249248 RepID=A0A816FEL1_ADIRI|nr:unnamed protein product [Adineta ricciae]CAF1660539.1 unnamed protein product [Adineta ricciae]